MTSVMDNYSPFQAISAHSPPSHLSTTAWVKTAAIEVQHAISGAQ